MKVYVDGAANMHVKRCGIGCVFENGDVICEEIEYGTNNDAEYIGLIRALEHAIETGINELEIFMDSMLVVQQVNGKWKINYDHLLKHNNRVKELRKQVVNVSVNHVRREFNEEADFWSKLAIDKATPAMKRQFLKNVEIVEE